jgi:hypothetical protein
MLDPTHSPHAESSAIVEAEATAPQITRAQRIIGSGIFVLLTLLVVGFFAWVELKSPQISLRSYADPAIPGRALIMESCIGTGLILFSPIVGSWLVRNLTNRGFWRKSSKLALAAIGWAIGSTVLWGVYLLLTGLWARNCSEFLRLLTTDEYIGGTLLVIFLITLPISLIGAVLIHLTASRSRRAT